MAAIGYMFLGFLIGIVFTLLAIFVSLLEISGEPVPKVMKPFVWVIKVLTK